MLLTVPVRSGLINQKVYTKQVQETDWVNLGETQTSFVKVSIAKKVIYRAVGSVFGSFLITGPWCC